MAPGAQIEWILRACNLPAAQAIDLVPVLREPYCEAGLKLPPKVFAAAPGILARLAGRYRMALICNTGTLPGVVMRTLLYRLGLWQHFELLVARGGWHGSRPYQDPRDGDAALPDAVVHGLDELPQALDKLE